MKASSLSGSINAKKQQLYQLRNCPTGTLTNQEENLHTVDLHDR